MSPSEFEIYIDQDPNQVLRLTLSSGDQILVRSEDRPIVDGLALILRGPETGRFAQRHRLVSVPNIALVEPVSNRPTARRRRK